MKRIIDGKTYNTETATLIAEIVDDFGSEFSALYQTRFGAFFRYDTSYIQQTDEIGYLIYPIEPIDAQKWLECHNRVNKIEKIFGIQPEAGEGDTRFTLRLPDSLRARIEVLAKHNGQSLNAWIMRCLETCANAQAQSR